MKTTNIPGIRGGYKLSWENNDRFIATQDEIND